MIMYANAIDVHAILLFHSHERHGLSVSGQLSAIYGIHQLRPVSDSHQPEDLRCA